MTQTEARAAALPMPSPTPLPPYSKDNFQDQVINLTVGGLCSRSADAHPAVSATSLGLEPIA